MAFMSWSRRKSQFQWLDLGKFIFNSNEIKPADQPETQNQRSKVLNRRYFEAIREGGIWLS